MNDREKMLQKQGACMSNQKAALFLRCSFYIAL